MPPFLRLPSIDEEIASSMNNKSTSLITHASSELELLRVQKNHENIRRNSNNNNIESHDRDCKNCILNNVVVTTTTTTLQEQTQQQQQQQQQAHFPSACLQLLKCIPGNSNCADCGAPDPNWASVSYGILLCLNCCGRHRGFGVQTSFVRSLPMDSWSHSQVLSMLEGGNYQLLQFFNRHSLSSSSNDNDSYNDDSNIIERRYKTKAALFYREKLSLHVDQVIKNGHYQGREASRATATTSRTRNKIKKNGCSSRRRATESRVTKELSERIVS